MYCLLMLLRVVSRYHISLRITLKFLKATDTQPQHIYSTQYGYCLYSGDTREDRNDDVMREVGLGECESREEGVERGEEVGFLGDV